MGTRADRVDNLVVEFVRRLGQVVSLEKVVLFGSRARGDFLKTSDYDLIIVSHDFSSHSFLERAKLVSSYWTSTAALEALCYTPSEFEKKLSQLGIVRQAMLEGVVVAAQQNGYLQ